MISIKKKIYYLAGLPRAGNTLLSCILNQNPKVKVTPNSYLPEIIYRIFLLKGEKIFQNFPYLIVSGGVNVSDIAHFLENNKEQCIVITTYASSHKVLDASMRVSFVFNMKILDEVHHLTSNNINEEENGKRNSR